MTFARFFRGGALGGVWLSWGLFGGCGQTIIAGFDDPVAGEVGGAGSGATEDGGAGSSGSGGSETGVSGAGAEPGAAGSGAEACVRTACRGNFYECGDCIDNDGDGRSDALDPECLGPCDNDEAGFSTGLKTTGSAPCRQDCYFDGDSGNGDDKCEWSQQCDPLSVAPDYPPSGDARCAFGQPMVGKAIDCAAPQPDSCLAECLPLVPNGCDCFGCCELPSLSGEYHFIGRGRGALGCELAALDDPAACPPCTPVDTCFNACERCEVCVGGGRDASCDAAAACQSGQACDAENPCGFGDYCVTGCCARAPAPR
ncbi:MAG TPA: hypothetical protein VEQ59_09090 [Polyangiaceae bacterium]|nr:hypothetical protein [Polyangiaceae bacterium]